MQIYEYMSDILVHNIRDSLETATGLTEWTSKRETVPVSLYKLRTHFEKMNGILLVCICAPIWGSNLYLRPFPGTEMKRRNLSYSPQSILAESGRMISWLGIVPPKLWLIFEKGWADLC